MSWAASKSECILVKDAELAFARAPVAGDVDGNLYRANVGHMIKSGRGSVLSYREFDDLGKGVDSQRFTKITIAITGDITGELKKGAYIGFVTFGSSGFVYKGDYWSSDSLRVKLEISDESKGGLRLSVQSKARNFYRKEERSFAADFTCNVVDPQSPKDLTPWQGVVGDEWMSFYPKAK